MQFDDYAQRAVDLVNADLTARTGLLDLLARRSWLAEKVRPKDLAVLRSLHEALSAVVDSSARGDERQVVDALNTLLAEHPVRPRISGHDASTWHLHVSDDGASASEIVAAEALLGLAMLVTEIGADRLGRCRAEGCGRAFLDLTTNQTKQYCSTKCATRTNVAAFRRRRRAAG
ncbi:MAG: CGNR zinc finger domain-containing protein [Acidimicrobiales bacterium]